MERLTVPAKKLNDGRTVMPIIDGRAVREHAMEFYWRLKEYEDLEEQGLLLKLPYNITTCGKLYFASEHDSEVYELTADEITIGKTMISNKLIYIIDSFNFFLEDFGKIVFKTKAEAEKALEEMEK